ncbi:MAG: hypothetical protein H7202_08385 [Pedobacter sp.]|nr:hypothetical protein [Pedobacter sp.]
MAIQEGIIPLSGKMGDVIFSNRKGKKYAKAKSTKPMKQTAATKKSSSDFGEASKVGARIRNAFAPLIKKYGDTAVVSCFTKYILKVFKTIPANLVGAKKFGQGDVGVFRSFQFNESVRLDSLLHQQPEIKLDGTGLHIAFKGNSIADLFKQVAKADAVVLQLMVYNLNFDGDDEVVSIKDLLIPLHGEYFRGAKLQVPLNLVGEQVVWVAMGVHFLNRMGMIGDKTKRAASVVFVARLRDGLEVVFVPDQPALRHVEKDKEGIEWELE